MAQTYLKWKYKNANKIVRTAASSSVKALADEKKSINKNKFFSVLSSRDKLLYIVKSDYLNDSKDERIANLVIYKLSNVFDCDQDRLKKVIKEYQCYLKKVNHPSKNMKYAISKGVCGKYNLINCQDEYFKNMKCPNPMLLKRLDEAMNNFIWNWDAFKQKYQII